MAKPKVNTNPVANTYAGPAERIVEYSMPGKATGGLIAFRWVDDADSDDPDAGTLVVDVYRHDPNVRVHVGKPTG